MKKELVLRSFRESIRVKEGFLNEDKATLLVDSASMIAHCFTSGGKLLIAGNGGSASDATHLAAEFVNRFEIERPPLPALALTSDNSVITSIGNDYSFDQIFAKQIKALGHSGDVLLAISTSGTSQNIINAINTARTMGIKILALTGADGSEVAQMADISLTVDSDVTARIQEVHITICHILCELVDNQLFGASAKAYR